MACWIPVWSRCTAPRNPVDSDTHRRVTEQFLRAIQDGSITDLVNLMAPNAVLITDGGGLTQAALRPIHGPDKIIRFIAASLGRYGGPPSSFVACEVNGQPGIAVLDRREGASAMIDSVCVFNLDGNLVNSILLAAPSGRCLNR